ncbi:MAG: prepilin-type N-terminal cleavage/methylation domain-containing protein [Candidatus Omnitrophota bacterium]
MALNKKGFTLIELLIVLIIIGVLATLAIPQYTGYVEKARAAEALSMMTALKTGQETYKLDAGVYSTDVTLLGLDNIKTTDALATAAGQYWSYAVSNAVGGNSYSIVATRSSKNPGGQTLATISLDYSITTGTSWSGTHTGKPKS